VISTAVAGIPLALLAATAYNFGIILEKRALERLPDIDVRRAVSLVRTVLAAPEWLAGFALTLCGLAFQVIVLTFEPVTVVQPVAAGGIVVILVLSRLVLHEHLGGGELGCIALMAISVVMLALSADGSAAAAGHSVSAVWMTATAVPSCLIGLLVAARALRAASRKHRARVLGISYGIGTGLLYGVAALAIKALSGVLVYSHGPTATVIGVVASPYLYVMAGCSAAGFLLFQTALQRCRASILVPVSNVVGSAYFIVAGTWLFHEHLPADPGRLGLRLIGILVAGSVLVLLPRQASAMPQTARPTAVQRH
jgi:drug/metabolite transporter (DMT)-like permease